MVAVSASLAVIVAKTAAQALAILEKLETEGGAIDLVAIVNSAQASSSSNFAIQCASLLLVAIWVISVVDAYALGKKQERAQQQPKTRL